MNGKFCLSKRVMAGLLSALVCFSMIPQCAYAAENGMETAVVTEETNSTTEENLSESESYTEEMNSSENETDMVVVSEEEYSEIQLGEVSISEEETRKNKNDEMVELQVAELESALVRGSDTTPVSKGAWLEALIDKFELSVDSNVYVDEYFPDVAEGSAYYDTVMTAVVRGLVDTEAGDNFGADSNCTREYAVHTLNQVLGFEKTSETYTFNECDDVTYADDIQIAVDKNWFEITDGNFNPNTAITVADKDALLAYGYKVCHQYTGDGTNEFEYTEAVIDLDTLGIEREIVDVSEEGDYTYNLYNVPDSVELSVGSIFGFVDTGLPFAKEITSVEKVGNYYVVTTVNAGMEDAFNSIQLAAVNEIALSSIKPIDEYTCIQYFTGGSEENDYEDAEECVSLEEVNASDITAVELTQYIELESRKPIKDKNFNLIDGKYIKFTVKFTELQLDCFYTPDNYISVSVSGKMIKTVKASADILGELDAPTSTDIAMIPLGELGTITLSAEWSLEASLTMTEVENFIIGVEVSRASGPRFIKNFYQDSAPKVETEVDMSIGLKLSYGINYLVLKANVYAKGGLAGRYQSCVYLDDSFPHKCENIKTWVYYKSGWSVNCSLGDAVFANIHEEFVDLNEMNSPMKTNYHYEDGEMVEACTRPDEWKKEKKSSIKYCTKSTSKFGINGASSYAGTPVQTYSFKKASDGTAIITGYSGNSSTLNIPETVKDGDVELTVSQVGDGSCIIPAASISGVRTVIIPDTVTQIGNKAFYKCTSLKQIVFSSNLKQIGYRAFEGCTSLTQIDLPDGLTELGSEGHSLVFLDCTSLSKVYIPASLSKTNTGSVVGGVFGGCPLDGSGIAFGEGITKIPTGLFAYTNIKNIKIPNTVTEIGSYAFYYDESLENVELSANLSDIGAYAFYKCTKLNNPQFPSTLSRIQFDAYSNCTSITEIVLPEGLTELGAEGHSLVFKDCTSLSRVYIPASLSKTNASNTVGGVFGGCPLDGSGITFGEGITQIPGGLFSYSNIKNITIPSTVTEIGNYAFYKSESLQGITLPEGLRTIGNNAFMGCVSLNSVMVPDNVTSIGQHIFDGCTYLPALPLSEETAVTVIPDYAFQNTQAIKNVTIPKNITSISGHAFQSSYIEKVTLNEKVTSIGQQAFQSCTKLSDIDMSKAKNLTTFGNYAFEGCTKVSEIELPDTVTSIGTYAFQGCTSLSSIKISSGLTKINNYMFKGCTALKSVEIPFRVTSIGLYAFTNCSGLTSIFIPESVTSIATNAFSYKTVVIKGKAGSYAQTFASSNGYNFESVIIPATDITFSAEKLLLEAGKEMVIPVNVMPLNQTDTVIFSTKSGGSRVIQITDSKNGKIRAIAAGKDTIVVTAGSVSAELEVEVYKAITSITITPSYLILAGGEKGSLTAKILPVDANQSVIWSVGNSAIAEVSETGVVTAKKRGTTTVRATSATDSSKYAEVSIEVTSTVNSITYILNDSEEEPARNSTANPAIYRSGEKEILLAKPIRMGYKFLYWYDSENNHIDKIDTTADGDLTLYAAWGPIPAAEDPVIKITDSDGFEVSGVISTDFTSDVSVELTCATEGAQIYYTIDGNVPAADSVLYTGPFNVCESTVVKAIAVADSYKNSSVSYVIIDIDEAAGYMGDVTDADVESAFGGDKTKIPQGIWVSGMDETLTYDGSVRTFSKLRVFDYKTLLTPGTDYTVVYKNNKNAYELAEGSDGFDKRKAPSLTINGRGSYIKGVTAYFTIDKIDIEAAETADIFRISDIQVIYKAGKGAKPTPVVKYNNKTLKNKTDYTYEYLDESGNVLPDIYGKEKHQVRVKGNGNYKGTIVKDVLIVDQAEDNREFLGNSKPSNLPAQEYIKGGYTIADVEAMLLNPANKFVIKDSKKKELLLGEDYEVREALYADAPGKATVVLAAKAGSDYVGSREITFTIKSVAISKAKIDMPYASIEYSGNANAPKPVRIILTDAGVDNKLKEGEDYYLTYINNINVGKATVIINGMGRYSGSKKVTFAIKARSESDSSSDITVTNVNSEYAYLKGGIKPEPLVKYTYTDAEENEQTITLQAGKDYTLIYRNNTKPAVIDATNARGIDVSPCVVIKLKGNYTGTLERHFSIVNQDISRVRLTVKDKEESTSANGWKSAVSLTDVNGKPLGGTDYDAKTVKYTYTYDTSDIARVKMDSTSASAGDEVGAKDLPPAGTYITVTVAGKGYYEGTIKATYRILTAKCDISKASAKIVNPSNGKNIYNYTGREIRPGKDEMIISMGTKANPIILTSEDYTIVGYSNNVKKGTATVTIKGCGKYGGTCVLKYTISNRNILDNWIN